MKNFFAKLIVFLSLFVSVFVAVPFSAANTTNFNLPWLSFLFEETIGYPNEILIKAGIGALMFLFSLIFFILSLIEQSREGQVSSSTAAAAFLPMFLFGIFGLVFAGGMAAFNYQGDASIPNLIILGVIAFFIVNLPFLVHLLLASFRQGKNLTRILLFVLLIEIFAIGGGAAYYLYDNFVNYMGRYTKVYVAIVPVALVIYVVHLFLMPARARKLAENAQLESEVHALESQLNPESAPNEASKSDSKPEPNVKLEEVHHETAKPEKLTRAQKHEQQKEQVLAAKGKKSTIVSREQTILSAEQSVDPTSMLFEEVNIDPEFNKTSNMDKQVSSIEYYIEKPKMFKPLDPTFDMLVAHVRGLPTVVTKISDERITFYVDRKAFLVLMNFGNYYRMAFRSDLEKGVRLIIKYPTISKNKGTKDALWFKANNYGDLPKEVVYEIIKTAFDNVNA